MELIKYNVNEAEIAKMSDIYMHLVVKDFDDKEGLEAVHTARMIMVKHRTAVDKLRKRANEDAQIFIKNNNSNAKKLLALMEPIETHLKTEENKIVEEEKRIKAEKERLEQERNQRRVDALLAVDVVMPFFDVAMMSDDDYGVLLEKAIKAKEEKTCIAEEERLAKEKAEKELAEKRVEIDRIEKEQEAKAKAQEEKEMALQAERDKIEAEKRAEQERKDRIAFEEKIAKESKIKAEKEATEKVDREARKKKEREEAEAAEKARQEELLPDKEKIFAFATIISKIESPVTKALDAQIIIAEAKEGISKIAVDIIKQAEEL